MRPCMHLRSSFFLLLLFLLLLFVLLTLIPPHNLMPLPAAPVSLWTLVAAAGCSVQTNKRNPPQIAMFTCPLDNSFHSNSMAYRVRFASHLLLMTLFFLAAYYLPQYVFGTVSLLHHDNSEPNLELCPGRQLLGLRLEYGKKLNVAITRMTPRTEYEVRLSYPASVAPPPHPRPIQLAAMSSPARRLMPACSTPPNALWTCD
jgi:hypothetical protein